MQKGYSTVLNITLRCASGEADEEPRDPEDIERCTDAWTWLFAVEAAIFFVSAAVFVMFGTAESK
jgi:hypothetical protein